LPTALKRSPPLTLTVILLMGAAVSVGLGVYGSQHTPTGKGILDNGLIFSGTINMKAWLASTAVALALFQVYSALRIYGKVPFPREMPGWWTRAHRISGAAAFVISVPVAYQCLWALGFHFNGVSTRVAAHSLLGCFFYGAFATKMLVIRAPNLPGWALPVAGGAVFASLVAIWLTSSLWFFQNIGFPSF
jgi:uncharacterized protein DUF6529